MELLRCSLLIFSTMEALMKTRLPFYCLALSLITLTLVGCSKSSENTSNAPNSPNNNTSDPDWELLTTGKHSLNVHKDDYYPKASADMIIRAELLPTADQQALPTINNMQRLPSCAPLALLPHGTKLSQAATVRMQCDAALDCTEANVYVLDDKDDQSWEVVADVRCESKEGVTTFEFPRESFSIYAVFSTQVDATGGTLVNDAGDQIVIPENALTEAITVDFGRRPVADLPAAPTNRTIVCDPTEIQPQATTLSSDAQLTLNCAGPTNGCQVLYSPTLDGPWQVVNGASCDANQASVNANAFGFYTRATLACSEEGQACALSSNICMQGVVQCTPNGGAVCANSNVPKPFGASCGDAMHCDGNGNCRNNDNSCSVGPGFYADKCCMHTGCVNSNTCSIIDCNKAPVKPAGTLCVKADNNAGQCNGAGQCI